MALLRSISIGTRKFKMKNHLQIILSRKHTRQQLEMHLEAQELRTLNQRTLSVASKVWRDSAMCTRGNP